MKTILLFFVLLVGPMSFAKTEPALSRSKTFSGSCRNIDGIDFTKKEISKIIPKLVQDLKKNGIRISTPARVEMDVREVSLEVGYERELYTQYVSTVDIHLKESGGTKLIAQFNGSFLNPELPNSAFNRDNQDVFVVTLLEENKYDRLGNIVSVKCLYHNRTNGISVYNAKTMRRVHDMLVFGDEY